MSGTATRLTGVWFEPSRRVDGGTWKGAWMHVRADGSRLVTHLALRGTNRSTTRAEAMAVAEATHVATR